MKKRVKVALTGSAGQIGYALLFRIAAGEMFGPDVQIELQLLELEQALPSLQGIIMELEDCAFPLLKNIMSTSDPNLAFKDVNWAILVGSSPRKAGMERSDLLKINGTIFSAQGKALNEYAANDLRVFVVGNPCNTNCLIAQHHAPDIPRDRFYAMTLLDENRARGQLAKKANVPVSEINHVAIWGNHSNTQFPDFYHAKINHKPVTEVIRDLSWLQNQFISQVQQRGAEVIKARGASSAASAANAALNSIRHLISQTPPDECFSVGLNSGGLYNIDDNLIFSFPCRVTQEKPHIIQNIEHNDFAKEKIQITLNELRKERDTIKDLGLI